MRRISSLLGYDYIALAFTLLATYVMQTYSGLGIGLIMGSILGVILLGVFPMIIIEEKKPREEEDD